MAVRTAAANKDAHCFTGWEDRGSNVWAQVGSPEWGDGRLSHRNNVTVVKKGSAVPWHPPSEAIKGAHKRAHTGKSSREHISRREKRTSPAHATDRERNERVAHQTKRVGRRVALCLTGAMKMNPDTAPAMAQHILSHVVLPWSTDVFGAVEILGTLIESKNLHEYYKILQPKRMLVYCPPTKGCHGHVATWCLSPSCRILRAPRAHPMWGGRRQLLHCGQSIKMSPTFEWQTEKRKVCYDAVLEHERENREERLSYDYIAYQRPEDWTPTRRSVAELDLLDRDGGIWVNNGLCNPTCSTCYGGKESNGDPPAVSFVRNRDTCFREMAFSAAVRAGAGAYNTSLMQRADAKAFWSDVSAKRIEAKKGCGAASDQAALVPRRFAESYFSAFDLVTQLATNQSFGCGESFGAASGICGCAVEVGTECLLSAWLRHRAVWWSASPYKITWAYGIDGRGSVIITSGQTSKTGVTTMRGAPLPAHCLQVTGAQTPYEITPHLQRLGIMPDMDKTGIYRWRQSFTSFVKCNASSPLW